MKNLRMFWVLVPLIIVIALISVFVVLINTPSIESIPEEKILAAIDLMQDAEMRGWYQRLYRSIREKSITLSDGTVLENTTDLGAHFQYTQTVRGGKVAFGIFTPRASENARMGVSCYPKFEQEVLFPYPVVPIENANQYGLAVVQGIPMISVQFGIESKVYGFISPQITIARFDQLPKMEEMITVKELVSWGITVDYMNWVIELNSAVGKSAMIVCQDGTTISAIPQGLTMLTNQEGKFLATYDIAPSLMSFGFADNAYAYSTNLWLVDIPALKNPRDTWRWILEHHEQAKQIPHVGDFDKLP